MPYSPDRTVGAMLLALAMGLAATSGCEYLTADTRGAKAPAREEPASAMPRATAPSGERATAAFERPTPVVAAKPSESPATPAKSPPVEAQLHMKQGLTFAAMRDWNNAIAEYTKAATLDPRHGPAYANRAVAYMQQRKFNKAMDDLKRAEGLDPGDKILHYNYVALYSLERQLDRSLDSLDRALELGFADYDALRTDPDLNNVRRHPEFRKVLEKHKVFLR
jgi:tetratricopeptide (TPR) repeat protein